MNFLSHFYTLRSYVQAYAGLLGPRFLTLIWVAAVCAVIWFYGHLAGWGDFQPLQSGRNRLILIGIVILAWVIYLIVSIVRARRRDKALVEGLENDAEADAAASQQAEVAEIRDRLKEALALLRRVTKKRFGYVYELPWYVIFGAPGSGKTTALTNSGLKFPLGDALGTNAVQGVGGTRNCNWWFTDEAILIDTAGRYTTQDDLNGASKAGWEGFLSLLKKHRRSQPINGVLVTLSIGDLLERESDARLEEVRAIRQRLSELDEFLQARVPIYLVLTKADLLTGFVEFFDGFNKSDREQVWGTTFGLDESYRSENLPDRFLEEFSLLQERVGSMLIERLQQEPDSAVRGRIFRFPAELASVRERLHEVLSELSASSKLVEAPLLRGVYFASGTQGEETAPQAAPRMRRSYFLSKLFHDVIFDEASLVSRDRRLSRRQMLLRRTAFGAACALVALVLASWIATYFQNTSAIARAEASIDSYEQQIRGIPIREVSDADFLRVLQPLDDLRGVTDAFSQNRTWPISFGLDQERKIASRQRDAYQRALNALLLPRMLVQLQTTMSESEDVSEVFDSLKLYGMLGGLGPVDPQFVESGAQRMFDALYPGEGRAAARTALSGHARALASGPIASVDLDDAVIDEARLEIAGQSMPSRAFDILRNSPAARALPPFIPGDALGPLGEQAFDRASQASLRDALSGLYTSNGYRSVVLPGITDAAREALNEGWVRGPGSTQGGTTVESVAQAALQLYFDMFEQRWAALLSDMRTKPSQTLADAAETTRVLAADPAPLAQAAEAIAGATDLRGLGDVAGAAAPSTALSTAQAPDPYAGLREALQGGEGEEGSVITALQPLLEALYAQLSRAATSSAEVAQLFDTDSQLTEANQALLERARQLPAPLDAWVSGIAADIGSLAVKSARASLGRVWEANGAGLCTSIVSGRYPFDRTSQRDVAMGDFVRLFAPEGLFATFFNDRLAPFVDTTSSPWRWRGTFGAAGMDSDAIAQFERADMIRRAFFGNQASSPNVVINITPVAISQSAISSILRIERENVVFFPDRPQSKSITWPSEDVSNDASVMFNPGGWSNALTKTGDWSPFRLFDEADIASQGQDSFRARFERGGMWAEFDIQFGSVLNPFRMSAMEEFECPTQF